MSGPYQGRDQSNCGVGRLRVAINCGILSINHNICWASSQEHLEFNLVCVVIFLRGSDPQTRQCLDNRCVNKRLCKRLENGNHDIHIIASQNVKIPGQMDLILDKWSIPGQSSPWMVGRYAISYRT